jgi:putative transcriptional regulator
MNTLKDHLLISVPHMNDTLFGKSVVYICEHNTEGAMGLIINKSINHKEFDSLIKIETAERFQLEDTNIKTYFGGPVLIEKIIVLHANNIKNNNTIPITSKISNSNEELIVGKFGKNVNIKYKLFFGHSGWDAGQLEREIENGDWLLQTSNIDLLFDFPSENLWEHATQSLGIDINDISIIGGSA